MAIASTISRMPPYVGNGTASEFAYTFRIFDEDDLVVIAVDVDGNETTLTKTTHYTLDGVGEDGGGAAYLVNGAFAWQDDDGNLDDGWDLLLLRVPSMLQAAQYRNAGRYFGADAERDLDKSCIRDLYLLDQIQRGLVLPNSVVGFDTTLPIPDPDRPFFRVNEAGTGLRSAAGTTVTDIEPDSVGPAELEDTAVTPGLYLLATITVDQQGRITAAASGSSFTTEQAQDAVGGCLGNTATVVWTYDDAGNLITANVPDDAISNAKLANMPAATVKLRALGAGTGDPINGTGVQVNDIIRAAVLTSRQRGVISANTGRALQYVAALDKILFVEGAASGDIMAIDPITDYPISMYASAKTPKGLVYAANSARLWMPNGTTDLFSVDPSNWTLDASGVGARCEYLFYCSGNGTLFGFDNGVSKIREFNSTTGVQIGADYANANLIANTTDTPGVYVAANNSIYFTDLFGTVRRFNCTTHAITSLGVLHTGATVNGASMILGSDGLLYITNGGSTDKYKIKVVDPATDTVTATIDLSANLTSVTGFYWVYEWRGYLYAGVGGSVPAAIVCVIDMATRILTDAIVRDVINPTTYAAGMAASPTTLRGYIGAAATIGFTSYLAFER